jgi:hypothetical protein
MNAVRKPEPDDDGAYVSVLNASKQIRKSITTVLSLIVRGQLRGKSFADRPFVSQTSIDEYLVKNPLPSDATPATPGA